MRRLVLAALAVAPLLLALGPAPALADCMLPPPIEEAVKTMEEKRLLNLPVKANGKVAYSVTRHDLLRAWIGLGTSGED